VREGRCLCRTAFGSPALEGNGFVMCVGESRYLRAPFAPFAAYKTALVKVLKNDPLISLAEVATTELLPAGVALQ
jgi:hypothetical protein